MEVEREDQGIEIPATNPSVFVTASVLLLAASFFLSFGAAVHKQNSPLDGRASNTCCKEISRFG